LGIIDFFIGFSRLVEHEHEEKRYEPDDGNESESVGGPEVFKIFLVVVHHAPLQDVMSSAI
jgi:hypothetical protein